MRPLSHAFLCTRFLYYPSYFHSGYIEVTPAATSVYYHLHASSHYLYSALRSLLTSYARERDLYPLLLLLAGHQIPIVRTSYIRIPPGPPLVRWHWPVQFFLYRWRLWQIVATCFFLASPRLRMLYFPEMIRIIVLMSIFV